MEQQKDIDISSLVEDASREILGERKRSYIDRIKRLFQRFDGVDSEIKKLNNQLAKATKKRDKVLKTIEEVKKGNWAALTNLEQESKENKNES